MSAPRIAFYAPMKAPDHPTPSGDREIARLHLKALTSAGFAPVLISRLRTLDIAGDAAVQAQLQDAAATEVERLTPGLAHEPPALWFSYHCHYKAPDLLGPVIAKRLGIPYALSEPSISPRRREGPWAWFAAASEAAIGSADRLYWTTERDRPALEAAGHADRMVHLPAFLDPGPALPPRPAGTPLRLLTVAMMRPGDKLESYRRLGAALSHLDTDWRLEIVGDGAARREVDAFFVPFGERIRYSGAIDSPERLRAVYEASDLLVWPGVNEGVGMVYLEAQAAGLPVVAEAHPAPRALIGGGVTAAIDDPGALADAILRAAAGRPQLSAEARAHVMSRHGIEAAARTLGESLRDLLV